MVGRTLELYQLLVSTHLSELVTFHTAFLWNNIISRQRPSKRCFHDHSSLADNLQSGVIVEPFLDLEALQYESELPHRYY